MQISLNKKRIAFIMLFIMITMLISDYLYGMSTIDENILSDKKAKDVKELIRMVYNNICVADICYDNCEKLYLTPSYEWMIKEIGKESPYDAKEMTDKLIEMFIGKGNYNSVDDFTITNFSYISSEHIEELNNKMINSAEICSQIYNITCDIEFSYIEEAYSINGVIRYKKINDELVESNFEGIVVMIDGKYYVYEYYTKENE